MRLFFALIVSVLLFLPAMSQSPADVRIRSWITGSPIREDVLEIKLDPSAADNFDYLIAGPFLRYKLSFRFSKADERSGLCRDSWRVILEEGLSKPDDKKEILGCNLLTVSGCASGGDYFPKEDEGATLFPTENAKDPSERIMIDRFYPIGAKRIFLVRNFLVNINVTSYEMNEANSSKLDSMSVRVEIKNIPSDYSSYK